MIDESNFAIFHLDENNHTSNSGANLAFDYAKKATQKENLAIFDICLLSDNHISNKIEKVDKT